MRSIVTAVLAAATFLSGCATVPAVLLTLPPEPERLPNANITVEDARPYRQLSMAMTQGAQGATMVLAPIPPVDEALKWHLRAALANWSSNDSSTLRVSLKTLDLVNRLGFASADKITCTMVSTIQTASVDREVKTVSTMDENLSPFVATAAQKSLDKCLLEHAVQLAAVAVH